MTVFNIQTNNCSGTWIDSSGSGTHEFTMSADCKSFTGEWWRDEGGGPYGWDGTRVTNKSTHKATEPQPWVRNHEFQCWQVWVNEANQFEFVFVWEYANNNHVQILDKDGNIIFYIDLPKGDCHFVANLPDGTYTVQNYHEYGHILREFVIGKP